MLHHAQHNQHANAPVSERIEAHGTANGERFAPSPIVVAVEPLMDLSDLASPSSQSSPHSPDFTQFLAQSQALSGIVRPLQPAPIQTAGNRGYLVSPASSQDPYDVQGLYATGPSWSPAEIVQSSSPYAPDEAEYSVLDEKPAPKPAAKLPPAPQHFSGVPHAPARSKQLSYASQLSAKGLLALPSRGDATKKALEELALAGVLAKDAPLPSAAPHGSRPSKEALEDPKDHRIRVLTLELERCLRRTEAAEADAATARASCAKSLSDAQQANENIVRTLEESKDEAVKDMRGVIEQQRQTEVRVAVLKLCS